MTSLRYVSSWFMYLGAVLTKYKLCNVFVSFWAVYLAIKARSRPKDASKDKQHTSTQHTCSAAATHSSPKSQRPTQAQEAAWCSMNPTQWSYNSSNAGGGLMPLARNWEWSTPTFSRLPSTHNSSGTNNKHKTTTTTATTPNTTQHSTRPSFQRPIKLLPNWLVANAHTMAASPVHSAATESFALTRSSRDYFLSPARPAASWWSWILSITIFPPS